jgi:hypothetical protein
MRPPSEPFYVEFVDPDDDQIVVIGVLRSLGQEEGKGKALVSSLDPDGETIIVPARLLSSAAVGVLVDPSPESLMRIPRQRKKKN